LIDADFNVVLYPETALQAAIWLERQFGLKYTKTIPIGLHATQEFVTEVAGLAGLDATAVKDSGARAGWYSRSVDSTYLTGKRVYIFGKVFPAKQNLLIVSLLYACVSLSIFIINCYLK